MTGINGAADRDTGSLRKMFHRNMYAPDRGLRGAVRPSGTRRLGESPTMFHMNMYTLGRFWRSGWSVGRGTGASAVGKESVVRQMFHLNMHTRDDSRKPESVQEGLVPGPELRLLPSPPLCSGSQLTGVNGAAVRDTGSLPTDVPVEHVRLGSGPGGADRSYGARRTGSHGRCSR